MVRTLRHSVVCFGIGSFLAAGCGSGGAAALVEDHDDDLGVPNIVLIVTDEIPQSETGAVAALVQSGVRYPDSKAMSSLEGWSSTAIRSSLLTGLRPATLGFSDATETLSAVPPAGVKTFPELLRAAGYFTVRNGVAHHGLALPSSDTTGPSFGQPGLLGAWDVAGVEAGWHREPGEPCTVSFGCGGHTTDWTPFFAMFNIDGSAESVETGVARVVAAIEVDGLGDTTVVLAIGTDPDQTSAIGRWPSRFEFGATRDHAVGVLDIAPTVLAAAGVPIPAYMEGRAFLGADGSSDRVAPPSTTARPSPWPDGGPPIAATPSGYPTGGVFHVAPRVELSCEMEDATIIYTTERLAPFHWRLYTGPFRMRFWTLRFQCGRLGYQGSDVVSSDFDIE